MLLIVLSKLHTLSYTVIAKYNDDFTILFVYIRRNALKPFQSLTLDL